MNTQSARKLEFTDAEFASLGGGAVAYVKEIDAGEAVRLVGPRMNVPEGARLFCLYGADGTPVSISGTREAAVANAFEHELMPMSVH